MDSIFANRMRVVPQRRGMRLLTLAVAGALGAALLLAGFHLGRHDDSRTDGETLRQLRQELRHGEARIEELEGRLADQTLSQIMDDGAYENLRRTIKELRDDLAETEEELRFYRQLMAPSADERGLRIERLGLTSGSTGNEIGYQLMLTQVVERHDWIDGEVSLEVIGRRDENREVLSLTELADPETYPLPFRFRYFQNFTGTLEIPEGFAPQRLVVTAKQSGAAEQLERSFQWAPEEG